MNRVDIPSKMYHGTFSYFMQQIKSKGLIGCKENCNYDFSHGDVVCLTYSECEAVSFVEAAEEAEEREEELNYTSVSCVVLEIDTSSLDKSLFFPDRNMQLDEGEAYISLEYRGSIPFDVITIVKEEKML